MGGGGQGTTMGGGLPSNISKSKIDIRIKFIIFFPCQLYCSPRKMRRKAIEYSRRKKILRLYETDISQ